MNENTSKGVVFCFCGRLITNNLCPKHKEAWLKWEERPKREKIGKWSGRSKRGFKGGYERD